MKLSAAGEFGLLEKLNRFWLGSQAGLDDCAVLPPGLTGGKYFLLSTDTMVEGKHFLRSYSAAAEIGAKLLAVNLSDIAAMGGTPAGILITLQLPGDLEVSWVEELYTGISQGTVRHGVEILGGDTVESPVLALGMTITGISIKVPITRAGAKEGDDLWVSGEIGAAGAGLRLLQSGADRHVPAERQSHLERYQSPVPRLELGKLLLEESIATSMIDVSDGLYQDCGHLARRSGKEIVVETGAIPLAPGVEAAGLTILEAGAAGDDYELLFTAPSAKRETLEKMSWRGTLPRLSRCGQVLGGGGGVLLRHGGETGPLSQFLSAGGFQHFRQP